MSLPLQPASYTAGSFSNHICNDNFYLVLYSSSMDRYLFVFIYMNGQEYLYDKIYLHEQTYFYLVLYSSSMDRYLFVFIYMNGQEYFYDKIYLHEQT
jgi:hypothetical protein